MPRKRFTNEQIAFAMQQRLLRVRIAGASKGSALSFVPLLELRRASSMRDAMGDPGAAECARTIQRRRNRTKE